jgi:hypothetical protein
VQEGHAQLGAWTRSIAAATLRLKKVRVGAKADRIRNFARDFVSWQRTSLQVQKESSKREPGRFILTVHISAKEASADDSGGGDSGSRETHGQRYNVMVVV